MAAFLAVVSAMCFALAAALQQRGQFALAVAGSAVRGLGGLFRLLGLRTGTAPSVRAAVLGLCAGLLFGVSAAFAKPVIDDLPADITEAVGDWRTWALLGCGFVAFLIQQLSLVTGQLAPAMAAVSVANPAASVILGLVLFEERLTRPGWHVVVAAAALLAALSGAVLITLANRETGVPGRPAATPRALTDETLR